MKLTDIFETSSSVADLLCAAYVNRTVARFDYANAKDRKDKPGMVEANDRLKELAKNITSMEIRWAEHLKKYNISEGRYYDDDDVYQQRRQNRNPDDVYDERRQEKNDDEYEKNTVVKKQFYVHDGIQHKMVAGPFDTQDEALKVRANTKLNAADLSIHTANIKVS